MNIKDRKCKLIALSISHAGVKQARVTVQLEYAIVDLTEDC